MENWKINAWWEKKSPEVIEEIEKRYGKPIEEIIKEETLSQKQRKLDKIPKEIKEEKKDARGFTKSLLSGIGWGTLLLGGIAASTLSWMVGDYPEMLDQLRNPAIAEALKNTNVLNTVQMSSFAVSIAGLIGTTFGIGLGEGWDYEGQVAREARENIKELKQLQKKLKKEVELANE